MLLKDFSKSKNTTVAPCKDLNYIINSGKRVTDLLKKLKNKNGISEKIYNKLMPVGSKAETVYESTKVNKALQKDCHLSDRFFQRLTPLHKN